MNRDQPGRCAISLTAAGDGWFGSMTDNWPPGFGGALLHQAAALDLAGNYHLSTPGTIE